jgi:hypothetical protein
MFFRAPNYLSDMGRRESGNEGEAAVLASLVRKGFRVLLPFGEGHPYDLAVHLPERHLLRVQCKTAWRAGGCMIFNTLATDHGSGPKSYLGHADIFGVYFPPTSTVYLIQIDAVAATEGRLRLEPTKNNQRLGIRFAADYEIDRWSIDSLRQLVSTSEITAEVATA